MWISDTSIKRPVFATMVILSFMVLGLVSMTRLGIDLFPEVNFPFVNIIGGLPRRGAGGSGDAGHQADRGRGGGHQRRQARRSRPPPRASRASASSCASKWIRRPPPPRSARRSPPSAIGCPSRSRTRPSSASTSRRCRSWCTRWARRSRRDVTRRQVEDDLKPLLEQIDGVAAVRGERRRGARDPGQPRSAPARGAEPARSSAVAEQAVGREPRRARWPGEARRPRVSLRTKGEFQAAAEVENVILRSEGGSTVRVKDVGTVVDGLRRTHLDHPPRTAPTRCRSRSASSRARTRWRSPTEIEATLASVGPSFPQLQIKPVHSDADFIQRERQRRPRPHRLRRHDGRPDHLRVHARLALDADLGARAADVGRSPPSSSCMWRASPST